MWRAYGASTLLTRHVHSALKWQWSPEGHSALFCVYTPPSIKTEMKDDQASTNRDTIATQHRYDRQADRYDITEAPIEFLAFRRLRRRLWSKVSGSRVLEIGVGTGKNLPYRSRGIRNVAIDLSPRMMAKAVRKAEREHLEIDFVLADAQNLPFRDGVFDAAVATFVFCSVPDPVMGLREVKRVVAPSGQVHLMEHVRGGNRIVGRAMDLLNPVVVRVSGANINRDTVSNVAQAGVRIDSVESHGLGIIKLIRGELSPLEDASKQDSKEN